MNKYTHKKKKSNIAFFSSPAFNFFYFCLEKKEEKEEDELPNCLVLPENKFKPFLIGCFYKNWINWIELGLLQRCILYKFVLQRNEESNEKKFFLFFFHFLLICNISFSFSLLSTFNPCFATVTGQCPPLEKFLNKLFDFIFLYDILYYKTVIIRRVNIRTE